MKQHMRQVLVIHGGDTFSTRERFLEHLRQATVELESGEHRGWKRNLQEALGPEYQVVLPHMPNKQNAQYEEWQIWFEHYLPLLHNGAVLVGHSLGAMFLAKYLAEHDLPFKPAGTMLVAAPYAATDDNNLIQFALPASLDRFAAQAGQVFLYHSKDDFVVDFTELEHYRQALPRATVRIFEDRGHFFTEEHFPELVADIRGLKN